MPTVADRGDTTDPSAGGFQKAIIIPISVCNAFNVSNGSINWAPGLIVKRSGTPWFVRSHVYNKSSCSK